MDILIIGGTRFIGPCVVRELCAAGDRVTVFHRGTSTAELPGNVEHIIGDRTRLFDFRETFRKCHVDVVVDMILTTEQQARSLVATFSGITGRIIAISSQDVYRAYGIMLGKEPGDYQSTPLQEGAALRSILYPYRGDSPRAEDDPRKILDDYDKIPVERVIVQEPDLTGTILRLPMVYGPGDYQHRLFEFLKRMDDERPAIILDKGLAAWRSSFGYVENVAHAVCCAVHDGAGKKTVYNVADAEPMTQEEWVCRIKVVTGWKGKIVTMPGPLLPPHLKPGFNTAQHLDVSTVHIRSELGYTEIVPFDRGLIRTIEWERKHPPADIKQGDYDYAAEDKALEVYEQQCI